MLKKYSLILYLPVILIAGCSSEDNKSTASKSSTELPIFNEQVKALEKAKEVEKVLQAGMEKQQQAIDEAVK